MEKLIRLQAEKKILDYKVKKLKKEIETSNKKEFLAKHRKILMILDICMVLVILFNIGAVMITNYLVVKEEPETLFYEVNVEHAEEQGYVPHPTAKESFKAFTKQIDTYWMIIIIYLFMRIIVYSELTLFFMILMVTWLLVGTGYDFFNNFGYYLGRIL